MKYIVTFLMVSFFTTMATADDEITFDDVVEESNIVTEPVEAGFGTQELLKVLEQPKVKEMYDELRKIGTVKVSAKKLNAFSYYTSKRTVYIFTAFQVRGWQRHASVASFSVEVYTQQGMTTNLPTRYKVSEITKM